MSADSSDVALSRNPANGGQNFQWAKGDVVFDDTCMHEVLSRLAELRAAWWADTDGTHGSKIFTIAHITAATPSDAEAYAREALAPMTGPANDGTGRITITKVLVSIPPESQKSRFLVSVYYKPRGSDQVQVARTAI